MTHLGENIGGLTGHFRISEFQLEPSSTKFISQACVLQFLVAAAI